MPRKTPYEKLETRIRRILSNNPEVEQTARRLRFDNQLLIQFTDTYLEYTKRRYYPRSEVRIGEVDYRVRIILNDNTVNLIGSIKPPKFIGDILKFFRDNANNQLNKIVIGADANEINGRTLNLTFDFYNSLKRINTEENREKGIRFKERAAPFMNDSFGVALTIDANARDYQALMDEIIASGQVTQADIQALVEQLEPGEITDNVIRQKVNRQVQWLFDAVEQILDEDNLNRTRSRQLGNQIFGYAQAEISGPEHLMEKILSDYGQYSLFGVPALLNTDKYVLDENGLPRSQFDILIVNHIGEIEVIELKRPDKLILKFDSQRNKFYASSDLSMAIAQTERYISAIMHENDPSLSIDGVTVKEFISNELDGVMYRESVRPTGLIIMGSSSTIYKDYDDQTAAVRARNTREQYDNNGQRAFREIKDSHKNIKIITYSELMESARARVILADDND